MLIAGETECGLYGNCVLTLQFFCKAKTISKYKVFKTPLNHNNEIGFCQTIFETPDDTEVLVLEMGMRGLGEIELLSKYAEPDITIICNVGTAHIGRLGSRENIAKAKCEIVKYQRGSVFIAHDDELIRNTVEFNGKKIFYSIMPPPSTTYP